MNYDARANYPRRARRTHVARNRDRLVSHGRTCSYPHRESSSGETMNDEKKFMRKIDRAIDRFGDKVEYKSLEAILQKRAQDMHEEAACADELTTIDADDLEGWQEE